MCDYNQTSRAAVQSLGWPLTQAGHHLGRPAHKKLIQAVANGRARQGRDLYDGRPVPQGSLSRGHYMSPQNFERELAGMAAHPWRCHWCHAPLPVALARQHQQPHDHREDIQHHFHPACWKARLLAVAAVFGHLDPRSLLPNKPWHRPRHITMRQMVILSVKRVLTLRPRGHRNNHNPWHR
ncbi:MAG: hypothetical protein ABSH34_26145 [Verrucomicrobiota bacterium]|jgi:hypothetical protein